MHFEDENGKKFMEAYIDGYQFGETLRNYDSPFMNKMVLDAVRILKFKVR